MSKKQKTLLYARAKEQQSWVSLIPYPSLLLSWQVEAVKREDFKTVKLISVVVSHKNERHNYCKRKCERIDEFIRKNLARQLAAALQRGVVAGQQILDIH